MNPISVLYTIDTMSQVEVFDSCMYKWDRKLMKEIVTFYNGKFKTFVSLDENLKKLDARIEKKIDVIKERLER